MSSILSSASPVSRRQFLQTSALGCASLAAASVLSAAEPPVRNGKPHFKLALAAYSFLPELQRYIPKPKAGKMQLTEFIDYCAEQNLDGTELTSYFFADTSNEYLLKIKEQAFRLGLDITGTAINNDFGLPEGPQREENLALTRAWIDYAAIFGAPVIRIFAGKTPAGDTDANAAARIVGAINELLPYAATKGVILALENHHGLTATPEQLLALVKQVNPSPWFGVNFDSGNFLTADPYADLEKIAPYAVNAQIKASMRSPAGEKSPADFKRIIEILKQAGYRGYITLEYEDKENPRTAVPRYLDQLRELIA
ncbi:sugar phosphate isomerase/epimerase family protein [Planctomicrobium sp. SH664]|uniref:sugar phosphate isomerase/epimerase family protein n=1 Tax=Planctomicrobium sp. SH664 TaxID=3448125 RepID=UPI003F5C5575